MAKNPLFDNFPYRHLDAGHDKSSFKHERTQEELQGESQEENTLYIAHLWARWYTVERENEYTTRK